MKILHYLYNEFNFLNLGCILFNLLPSRISSDTILMLLEGKELCQLCHTGLLQIFLLSFPFVEFIFCMKQIKM